MPITIDIRQGGEETARWMLFVTFCLSGASSPGIATQGGIALPAPGANT
jgi:hypothetical protein